MNWADAVIIVVILLSILIGVFRGFTREVLGTLAWVAAFWLALHFYKAGADTLANHIQTVTVRLAVSFGGLFLITLITGSIIAWFAAKSVRAGALAPVDRTLGGGFGFMRGLLIIAALLLVAETTPAKDDPWWRQSWCIQHLGWSADALRSITPRSWLDAIAPHEEVHEALKAAPITPHKRSY